MKEELIRIQSFSNEFQWSLLSIAPWNTFKKKNLEAYFIKIMEGTVMHIIK